MMALLVDGYNLVRRIHAARQYRAGNNTNQAANTSASNNPSTDQEDPAALSAVVVQSLRRAIADHQPSHLLIAFDASKHNWRHQIYPSYKANRPPMPDDLQRAMPHLLKELAQHNWFCHELTGYEADDIIATVALKIRQHQGQVTILSTDRNFAQLLDQGIRCYDHFSKRYLTDELIQHRYGITAKQLTSLQALAGESGLNIPGVVGVGPKTAARLLIEHGDLAQVFTAAPTMKGTLSTKLLHAEDEAHLALQVLTLKTDIHLGFNLQDMRLAPVHNSS